MLYNAETQTTQELKAAKATELMNQFEALNKSPDEDPISLVHAILCRHDESANDGAFEYECLVERIIQFLLIPANHNAFFKERESTSGKTGDMLFMLLWYFRELQRGTVTIMIDRFNLEGGSTKESTSDAIISKYTELIEIEKVRKLIRETKQAA